MKLNNETVKQIDEALKLHINYKGISSQGRYLKKMDILASSYNGAKGIKVSKLLEDYYKTVNVSNLDEALERLRQKN